MPWQNGTAGGGSIFTERSAISAGRSVGSIQTAGFDPGRVWPWGWGPGMTWGQWGWPRGGMCTPPVQCCCKGPWNLAPGDIQPLAIDWSQWLTSVPDYRLKAVLEASLIDMGERPPVPADADVIKIVSGMGDDPDPPDNADAGKLVNVVPPYHTHVLLEAARDAEVGSLYRLNICVQAMDCDGRKLRHCDCVVVAIAEC